MLEKTLINELDFSIIKVIILGSPGFVKDDFYYNFKIILLPVLLYLILQMVMIHLI